MINKGIKWRFLVYSLRNNSKCGVFHLKEFIPKINYINIDKIPFMLHTGGSKIVLNSKLFINPWKFNEETVLGFLLKLFTS